MFRCFWFVWDFIDFSIENLSFGIVLVLKLKILCFRIFLFLGKLG